MAIINCSECHKEISDKAFSCPNCGAPTTTSPTQQKPDPNACEKCGTRYTLEQKNAMFSPISLLTIPMFFAGVFSLPFSLLAGIIIIAIAWMIGHFGRDKKIVMVCPKCRYQPGK